MENESIRTQDGRYLPTRVTAPVFTHGVPRETHMLKKPPAWCFDVSMFTNPSKEIHTIVVVTDDTQKEYSVSVEKFFVFAKKIDRGHNLQYMLPLQYWTIKGKTDSYSIDWEAEQLNLFGEKEKENAKKSKDNTG